MLNKVYLIALAVFLLIMSVLTYVSCDWLSSITNPKDVVENYAYYSNLSRYFLWISALVLLALANVILWKTRSSWAFWTTLVYFALFVILQTFWLDKSFLSYQAEKNLIQSGFSLSPLIGVGLCIAAAFIVFFNQFVVTKMHDKTFAKEVQVEPLPEDETADETENEKGSEN